MNDDKTKVVERVRKILALASNNPNENEAAAAAEKAQAILAEYNLSMLDVSPDEKGEDFEMDEFLETDSVPWRRSLAMIVARLYFCEYFFQSVKYPSPNRARPYVRKDRHTFVGESHNLVVAKMMFQYLNDTTERLAKEGSMCRSMKERTSYRTSFKHACAGRLFRRISDRIEAAKAGNVKTAEGTNLPALRDLYDQSKDAVGGFMKAELGKDLVTHKRKGKITDSRAYADGVAAGDRIGLDQQVGSSGASHLLGGR